MNDRELLINKIILLILIVVIAFNVVSAASTTTSTATCNITCALYNVCSLVNNLLPIIAFVLFILAGVAYAAGQFFGAETRARAIGYAMNMITGAIIALILGIIGPTIIMSLSPGNTSGFSGGQCSSILNGCSCAS